MSAYPHMSHRAGRMGWGRGGGGQLQESPRLTIRRRVRANTMNLGYPSTVTESPGPLNPILARGSPDVTHRGGPERPSAFRGVLCAHTRWGKVGAVRGYSTGAERQKAGGLQLLGYERALRPYSVMVAATERAGRRWVTGHKGHRSPTPSKHINKGRTPDQGPRPLSI
jgi:hypothetical protein